MMQTTVEDMRIADMTDEDAEIAYAFYMEYENEKWARFERILGTTWTYEDVATVQVQAPKKEGEKDTPPQLLGPGSKVFYPLAQALNPQLMTMIMKRFSAGNLRNVFGDEGIDGNTSTMFDMPKRKFMQAFGEAGKEDDAVDVRAEAIKYVPNKKKR